MEFAGFTCFICFRVSFHYKEHRSLAQSLQQMVISLKVNNTGFFLLRLCVQLLLCADVIQTFLLK